MVTREIHTFLAMESTWYDAVRAWNVEEVVVYDTSPRLFPVRSQAGSGVGASRVDSLPGRVLESDVNCQRVVSFDLQALTRCTLTMMITGS